MADLTGDGTLEVIAGRGSNEFHGLQRGARDALDVPSIRRRQGAHAGRGRLERDGQVEIIVGRASGGATKQLSVYAPNGSVRARSPRGVMARWAMAGACTTPMWGSPI